MNIHPIKTTGDAISRPYKGDRMEIKSNHAFYSQTQFYAGKAKINEPPEDKVLSTSSEKKMSELRNQSQDGDTFTLSVEARILQASQVTAKLPKIDFVKDIQNRIEEKADSQSNDDTQDFRSQVNALISAGMNAWSKGSSLSDEN